METLWVYILITNHGHLYTGWTTDLERRFKEHKTGKKGAKYTRAFKVKKIACSWSFQGSRSDALKIEAFIKKQNRQKKLEYINCPDLLNMEFMRLSGDSNLNTIMHYELQMRGDS